MAGVMYTATESGLTDALAVLGETPEKVAESLRSKGIKGHRFYPGGPGSPYSCPIAIYLHSVTGRIAQVDHEEAALGEEHEANIDWPVALPLPDGVKDFVEAFDCGMFDDLAEEAVES